MKILIVDPHGLAGEFPQVAPHAGDSVLRSNGILETVWMLGTEAPHMVIVIQPPGPDVDWVKLSRSNCPSARIVSLPVPHTQSEAQDRLWGFWQNLPQWSQLSHLTSASHALA